MAKKISELTIASTLSGIEQIEVVQAGDNKRVALNDVVADLQVITATGVQTLSNKTLTAPDLGTPSVIILTNAVDATDKRLMLDAQEAKLDALEGVDKRVLTDAEQSKLAGIEALADITDAANVGAAIQASANKAVPVGADRIAIIDTISGNILGYSTLAQLIAQILTTNSIATGMVQDNAIGNAKAANAPGNTLKGNDTAILGDPVDITINSNTIVGRGINNLVDLTLDPSLTITAGDVLKVPEVGSYLSFIWDGASTADSDPGINKIRGNNATPASITQIYLDDVDRAGRDVTGYISVWGIGGTCMLTSSSSYLVLNIATITDVTGYTKLIGTYIAGAGFSNGDIVFLTYLDGAATPAYTNLSDAGLPSPVTYPNFVAIITNVSGNTFGRPGIFRSNGTVYNGIGRQTLEQFNGDNKVYATNAALTWTVANNAGNVRLTSSAAHGIPVASYTNSSLHIKTASGSFFGVDELVGFSAVGTTTTIDTTLAWNAGMAGATPVFSVAGDKFKIATTLIPVMRANSRLILDQAWIYPNNANNKTPEVQFGGIIYFNPVTTTTELLSNVIEVINKNSVSVQESRLSKTSLNSIGTGTIAGLATSTIDTSVADNHNLTWHGTCAVAGDFIGLRAILVEMIY